MTSFIQRNITVVREINLSSLTKNIFIIVYNPTLVFLMLIPTLHYMAHLSSAPNPHSHPPPLSCVWGVVIRKLITLFVTHSARLELRKQFSSACSGRSAPASGDH